MSDSENNNQPDFQLIVVVPLREEGGLDPAKNQYYLLNADDVLSDYQPDPAHPGQYTKVKREPLGRTELEQNQWPEFVTRDVHMAHKPYVTRGLGTFLVNLASFGNKKTP